MPSLRPELVLAVPPRWAAEAALALDQLAAQGDAGRWHLNPVQASLDDLAQGLVDVALLPDGEGFPVAERPLALAVPFGSDWHEIDLDQAGQILVSGSPFVTVIDWSELDPTMRSLRVAGLHPSEPGYPLGQPWSLHARVEYMEEARLLAPVLAQTLSSEPVVQLTAVGDVMLDRTIGLVLETGDLDYPFRHVGEALALADLAVGNLECSLGTEGSPEPKGYTFRAPPQAAQALARAGFDLLTLANNHAMDFGPTALTQTIDLLAAQGVAAVGAGADARAARGPAQFEIDGLSIAFLGYVDVPQEYRGFDAHLWRAGEGKPGVAWADPEDIRADVASAREEDDIVVVLLHSGFENVPQPSPAQEAAAHAAIDAGAQLVLGHHAHVLQGIEFYGGGVIAYGLGNFAFEDAGPRETALLRVWVDRDGVREVEVVPLRLDDEGRPWPAEGELADEIRRALYALSRDLHP